MSGKRMALSGVLALAVVVAWGCTPVQKGAAAGGVLGTGSGAAIGHYAGGLGGSGGALVGMGLGATAGAIAGERLYGSDNEELAQMTAEVERLQGEIDAKDRELRGKEAALERERAQQRALLEQYERVRGSGVRLQADAPAGVEVKAEGDTVTYTILSEVLFDSGRAELTSAGKTTLRRAVAAIRNNHPDARIEVRGHTDNVPIRHSPFKSNWDLSCARAVAVVHHLIESEDFNPERLAAVGHGDTRPVATNSTADGRRQNRRAELVVRLGEVQVAEGRKGR